jgi:hypothetical protein
MFFRSPSGSAGWSNVSALLATASDSPVSSASMQVNDEAISNRASAATTSPGSSARMSPGTTSAAATVVTAPSRRTFAWGAVIRINAATDFSALNSW